MSLGEPSGSRCQVGHGPSRVFPVQEAAEHHEMMGYISKKIPKILSFRGLLYIYISITMYIYIYTYYMVVDVGNIVPKWSGWSWP